MITYNPRKWFKFLLTFHKEDTFRRLLPMLVAISVYSFAVACIEFLWWHISDDKYAKNLSMLHNLLGFVLSLLLVFRTNSAYDRWWEGSILWNQLTNVTRNFAMKLDAIIPANDQTNRHFFAYSINFFAFSLRDHLRVSKDFTPMDVTDHFEELDSVEKSLNKPVEITSVLYKRLYNLQSESKLNGEQLLSLYTDVEKLNDICGACERIKNTPIPSSYSIFVKRFVYVYIMTLPFGFVFSLGFYTIPVVAFVFYVLASLQIIAEEIEDPFGDDANDIPTNKLAVNIKAQVDELLLAY
ncbi:MAG TPA: bestrophin family protein [Parafilimonas sp.]|nr:bestrophin family protein [Parafilimonas sp.]